MRAALQVALQGIPGIRKVFIREAKRVIPDEAAPDGYANETEWMLDTEGVNLLEARARMAPAACLQTFCNMSLLSSASLACICSLSCQLAGLCAG